MLEFSVSMYKSLQRCYNISCYNMQSGRMCAEDIPDLEENQ